MHVERLAFEDAEVTQFHALASNHVALECIGPSAKLLHFGKELHDAFSWQRCN